MPDETLERVQQNLSKIQQRIHAAIARGGRAHGSVQLIAVTKSVGLNEIQALACAGCTHFGENRVEVALPKIEAMGDPALRWHMIGNIQRRKLPQILAHFHRIDAVDRDSLFEPLQRRCEVLDTTADILLEVNVSGEAAKHGFAPGALGAALKALTPLERIRVNGVLTMAPFDAPESALRGYFATLRQLAADHGLPEISMGMTQDFEIAIEEGATQVRIGTALFA